MAKPFKIVDKDMGFKEVQRRMRQLAKKPHVKVGIQKDADDPVGTDFTYAEIASIHEFGTRRAGRNRNVTIPARPFMRTSFDENAKKWTKLSERLSNQILELKTTIDSALDRLGLTMQSAIRRKITTLKSPPLSPVTLAMRQKPRKGKKKNLGQNPLVDTGTMRRNIQYKKGVG